LLAITLDSASNNDTLISTLSEKVEDFPGAANQVRCFNHVVNIVARNITSQFDVPKAKADEALAAAELALQELALGIDIEEVQLQAEMGVDGEDSDDDDNEILIESDDWLDEREQLSEAELSELNLNVLPVRVVLVKVRTVPLLKSVTVTH
jgi:hypothetical protein